jgi:hypothetical protein
LLPTKPKPFEDVVVKTKVASDNIFRRSGQDIFTNVMDAKKYKQLPKAGVENIRNINVQYELINLKIDQLAADLKRQMKKDKDVYMD